jgi:hypothetical protein
MTQRFCGRRRLGPVGTVPERDSTPPVEDKRRMYWRHTEMRWEQTKRKETNQGSLLGKELNISASRPTASSVQLSLDYLHFQHPSPEQRCVGIQSELAPISRSEDLPSLSEACSMGATAPSVSCLLYVSIDC